MERLILVGVIELLFHFSRYVWLATSTGWYCVDVGYLWNSSALKPRKVSVVFDVRSSTDRLAFFVVTLMNSCSDKRGVVMMTTMMMMMTVLLLFW